MLGSRRFGAALSAGAAPVPLTAFQGLIIMAVDKATVAHIAKLARIRLPEAQQEALTGDLNKILGWVEQLGELDTEGVAPMTSVVEVRLPMREDAVTEGNRRKDVLANAPEAAHGFFAVPKVVE